MNTQALTPQALHAGEFANLRMEDIQAAQTHALAQAARALWVSTLSLMSAFMQNRAPAHRYLLAKRISRNFALLQEQECFVPKTRESFARLATRWSELARKCSLSEQESPGLLRRVRFALFSR